MKCRARQQMLENAANALTHVYGTRALTAIQSKAALLLLDGHPWFRHGKRGEADRLKQFFDGMSAQVNRELAGAENGRVFVHTKRGRREADRYERFDEIVNDAEYRLTRRLGWEGIDAEKIQARANAAMPGRLAADTGDMRLSWYAWLGRRGIRTWLAAAGLALSDMQYPCGRRRFTLSTAEREFLIPLADFASGWVTEFLAGHDRALEEEQRARARRLADVYNVDMTPVNDGMPGTGKPPEGSVGAGKTAVPELEVYGKILADVQSGVKVYIRSKGI